MQAAEAVRRFIDSEHEQYGHDHAFYARAPESAERVLPNWRAYLDGSISLEEALDAIVVGLGE
jgi:hypothetical protein